MMTIIDDQSIVSRKQSASDLQSRLKTRKLLGVGELARDNGDIYRSKISQLLGINENLYVRLPKGMLYWNTVNTAYFFASGFLIMVVPKIGLKLLLNIDALDAGSLLTGRLYGVVLLCFGILFRAILQQRETRSEISTLLLVTALLHALQLAVLILSSCCTLPLCLFHTVLLSGNIAYHTIVDPQGGLYRHVQRIIEHFHESTDVEILKSKSNSTSNLMNLTEDKKNE